MRKILLLAVLLTSATALAQNFATSFETTEVAPGVYMVEGVGGFGGGNMAVLIGDDHIAMIDDSMPPLAPMLLEHVLEATDGADIDFMINTHVHGDHVGGNAHFAESGTVVFAHDNIRRRLIEDPSPAGGAGGLPVVTFADGVTFHLNDLEARVIHMPTAHTDGDAIIHFPGVNVIHTGDIWFHDLFPFIDLDNGGDVDGYIAAQIAIWEMADDDTKIIPGHGGLADRRELRNDIDMLVGAQAAIKALFDDGMSEDDVVAANPLAEYHETYNWGFITTERMTRTIYRDLEAGN